MGKIRVKTIGDEDAEKQDKKKQKERHEQKKFSASESLSDSVVAREKFGAEDKLNEKTATTETSASVKTTADKQEETKKDKATANKTKKAKFAKKKIKSQKYQTAVRLLEKNKIYSLTEALEILPKVKLSKFDETIELHINTTEIGVNGKTSLPHGTGKDLRVAIADDKIISEVEAGKINFDILLANPAMMPKLAKIARFLGPKGLMPNPKNGTITNDPEKEAEKYKGGFLSFRTEAKAPIIHMIVGKLSFGDKKLAENIKTVLKTIQKEKIKNITLKSTMSPAIKIDFNKLS